LIYKTTSDETENLISILEKYLNTSNKNEIVLYSLEEIENLIIGSYKTNTSIPKYLIITDKYLSDNHEKNRLNRLIQIAINKNVKTRIVNSESKAGLRITQLGGMVCFS
jgi:stalled ribosome rescue protein Dom34